MNARRPACQPAGHPFNPDAQLLRDVLRALWLACWKIRWPGRRADVARLLPAVATKACLDEAAITALVAYVDQIARRVVWWKGSKRCFYRSFAAATALRLRGVPAELHVGMRLARLQMRRCHCWVSVANQAIAEPVDPHRQFPVAAGHWQHTVWYWLAAGEKEPP
jgi:hypothetical protein